MAAALPRHIGRSASVERNTAPDAPPALKSEAEGQLPQKRSCHRPPLCQNSEPVELPRLPPQAELEAAANEVGAVASEDAAGSPPALDAMDGEAASESQSEVPLQEPVHTPSPKMESEACSPDMSPPGFKNCKSKWLPQPVHTMPFESTHHLVEAPVTDTADVMPEAAVGSLPTLETMDVEMGVSAGQLPSSKSEENKPLHQTVMVPSSLTIEAAPCSPDSPPPGFENFRTSWLPQPTVPPSAETTDTAGVMPEAAVGSLLALETMDVEMGVSAAQLPSSKSDENRPLHQSVMAPSSLTIEAAPCSPDSPPPGFENFKTSWLPQPTVPPSAEITDPADVMPEEVIRSLLALETTDVEMGVSAGQLPSSKSEESRKLHQLVMVASSLTIEAVPCSPDTPPPGFENFKTSWLPQPTIPPSAETTDIPGVMPEAAVGSLPTLETMGVEMGVSAAQLPSSKSEENRPLHQSVMVSSSLTIEAAPCSPDTPPPGFENFKTSWLPQPTVPPSAETTCLPDMATTKEELVEKSCSVPTLDTTDMETDTARNLLPTLESGTGDLLEMPELGSSSPRIQPAPCSPCIMPPGFESLTLPQLQLPSPVSHTSHISHDPAATGAVRLTPEDAPQPSPVSKAVDLEVDAAPALPSSETGAQESIQQDPSWLASQNLEIVLSGSQNLESLENAMNTTVTVDAVGHPLSLAEATEESKGHIPPPQLENGCDGPLPCQEPKASFTVAQAAPSLPGVFESLESSEQTSPRLAERIDSPSHLPFTKSVTVKSGKMAQPLSPLQATDTDLESAPVLQAPLKSEEMSLPHPQHQPSSPSGQDAPCSPDIAAPGYENFDSSDKLLPPPPLWPNFEMGQMVCGCCRELIAYPRGATHVQCFGCWTINLVLEEHQVGKVYCGQCETLLIYPFGAPAVRCSNCLFVTEIGEETDRNVSPRMSAEQETPPHSQEVGQA